MFKSKSKWWAALAALAVLAVAAPVAAQPTVYLLGQVSTTDGVQQYLTVVDGATNRKGTRIQLGKSVGLESAHLMAIAPDGERIYVLNDRDNTVSVISTATNTVIDTLPRSMFVPPGVLGSPPIYALAVSPDSRRLYVSGLGLAVIDTASRTRVNPFLSGAGFCCFSAVVSPDGSRLYVRTAGGGGGMEVYDTTALETAATAAEALIASVSFPDERDVRGTAITVSPNGRFVYIPQSRPGGVSSVAVVDTTSMTFTETPTPGADAFFAAPSPNGSTVYVAGRGNADVLHRLSPTTHASLGTTNVANGRGVAFTADSARAYVAAMSAVYVIDTTSHAVIATIPFFSNTDGNARSVVTKGSLASNPAPSNLAATIIGNRVTLTWTAPTTGTPTGYVVEGGTAPGQTLTSIPTGRNATSFTFDAPTGSFYVRVRATTASGLSPASNEIRILVNMPQAPSAPTGLLGLANGSNLVLSWRASSTGGVPTLFMLNVSGPVTMSVPVPVAETVSFAGVPPGTYTFAVRAVNSAGTSAPSSPVTLTFPSVCPGPPQAPSNLVVAREGSRLTVSWDPPSAGPAASSYVLNVTGALTLALPMSTRSISGAVSSGSYTLSVTAVNPCGASVESVPQSVSVP